MGETLIHKPSVTVLMPVFNAAAYVLEAINSILNQTHTDFELLIINDGSTDNSVSIIESIKDERLQLVHNEKNIGLIETLNKGFALAKGKYIARMDADDVAYPERISIQFRYLETHPDCDIYGSAYQEFYENKVGKTVKFSDNHELLKTVLFFNSCLSHPTVMIRKSLLIDNHITYSRDFNHAEDYALWVQLVDKTRFSNCQKALLKYRVHASQVSQHFQIQQQQNADKIRFIMLNKIGIEANAEEQTLHQKISKGLKFSETKELMQLEAWFKKLIEANQKLSYVNHKVFSSYLAAVFADACAGTSHGFKAFYLYYISDLAEYQSLNAFDKLKLLIKCLMR